MSLATRFNLVVVTLSLVVATSVGYFTVASATAQRYQVLDAQINDVIDSGRHHPIAAVSEALNTVQANNYNLTLVVVSPSGDVTVSSATTLPRTMPTPATIQAAVRTTSVSTVPGFHFRAEAAGGGDVLLVFAPTGQVQSATHHLELLVALVALLIALAAILLAGLVVRRDVSAMRRLIRFAHASVGGSTSPVPEVVGSPEVRDLRQSLSELVTSFRGRVRAERENAEAMQRFVGDASHELRTPLTVIRGSSELLERDALDDEERARALARITREAQRMDGILGNLLALTEAYEVRVGDAQRTPLSATVAELARHFQLDHPARAVTVEVTPDLEVRGRTDLVERFVHNALSNIEKYTAASDPVRIAVTRHDDVVDLVIEDGGPGLPSEAYGRAPRRFERFDAARDRRREAPSGTGLGLSIMAEVANACGASFALEASPLGGLRVALTWK